MFRVVDEAQRAATMVAKVRSMSTRAAVARYPGQAIPLAGSWFGDATDYLGMSINVAVQKIGEFRDPSED